VLVVPTDEEIVIVRDTMTLTRGEVAQTVGVVGE
jgi:hypothetical protein